MSRIQGLASTLTSRLRAVSLPGAVRQPVVAARYLVKWLLILAPVSALVGTACAALFWALEWVTDARIDHPWLLFALPLIGLAVGLLYHQFGRSVESGTNLLLDEIHQPGGGVPARIAPLVVIGTVATHLGGGSAGREGTAAQLGGGIASGCNRLLRLRSSDLRTLLMAGVAAGFGAVFGTPLAGAVFAMEVLTVGRIQYDALAPVLMAALLADWTATAWGIRLTHYSIATVPRGVGDLPIDATLMAKAIIVGIAFGLASRLFATLTHETARLFRERIETPWMRPIVGGVIVIALTYALGTRAYLGSGVVSAAPGDTSIVSSFSADGAAPLAWWWKTLFTALTLGSGFRGGEVTPLLFIGAALGNRFALLLGAPVDLFAGMGFVAVFAAAANTPLAGTIMGIELFGVGVTSYIAVACVVAYLVSGSGGIYRTQRHAVRRDA